jgi:hypothetical protein
MRVASRRAATPRRFDEALVVLRALLRGPRLPEPLRHYSVPPGVAALCVAAIVGMP